MISLMSLKHHLSKLDQFFYGSLILKAIDSGLEILGGLLAWVVSPISLSHVTQLLTQHELSQDPHDFLATHLLKVSQAFTGSTRYFAAFYLLSHGLVKLVLIVALFKQKLWAYPAMIVVLGAFIIYQLYRLSYHFSIGLLLLTLFDGFIVWLTWREYRKHQVQAETKATT